METSVIVHDGEVIMTMSAHVARCISDMMDKENREREERGLPRDEGWDEDSRELWDAANQIEDAVER